ncbi:MAG: MipA/OmpV family protein [Asticcacaulis sp.]
MLKTLVSGAALTLSLSLVPAASVLAQAQPFKAVEQTREWTIDVGGGMVQGFSPAGKDPNKTRFTPWASANWKGRVYANGLDGLGVNTFKRDDFNAGFQLRPRYSGQSDLEGLDLPGRGVDLATYAYKRIGDNTVIGGRIGSDISDESRGMDFFASVARQDITRVGLLQSMIYVRGGDKNTNQAFYGVDAREAAATGLEAYDLGGGIQSTGLVFMMMTPIGDKYGVGTFVNVERALGDVADSPLIERRKHGETAYRGGFVVVRRFHSQ